MTGEFESLYKKIQGNEDLFGGFKPESDEPHGVYESLLVVGYAMNNPDIVQRDSERIISAYSTLLKWKEKSEDPETTSPCLKDLWASGIDPAIKEFEAKFSGTIDDLTEQ
jgi:hypothetical protein